MNGATRRILTAWAMVLALATGEARADEAAAWRALEEGGAVAMMRHALAPGTGDPANFTLGDCATQRNLSEEGREQARRIGAMLRARDIAVDGVWSSQWCRCLETARLLDLGPAQELPPLNSFFRRPERRAPQLAALKDWLADVEPEGVHVLVTHQVVISGVTGDWATSGATVVVRPRDDGTVEVIGTIPPP